MNERIKELIKECTTESDGGSWTYKQIFDKEKFAKLIIKECINQVGKDNEDYIVDGYNDLWNSALDCAAWNIKTHFGVE